MLGLRIYHHTLRRACTPQDTQMTKTYLHCTIMNMIYGEKYIHIYKIIKVGRPGEMPSVCHTLSRTHTHTHRHAYPWSCALTQMYKFFLMNVYCAHTHSHRPHANTRSLINGCGDCVAPRHPFRDRLAVMEYVWHIQISPARSHCIS